MPSQRPPPLLGWAAAALRPERQRPARHHLLLLEKLTAIANGEIDRLMVLMPPGSAKSTYGSAIFPAWWLSRHPRHSIIAASHTSDLAEHFARRVRALATEHPGRLHYEITPSRRAAGDWTTTRGGSYFATGVRGPITGRRADLVLIDDPVKGHAEADSATLRDHIWDWYRGDLLTRLKPHGRIVLIMTRWHQDDLGGRVLETPDGWTVLKLPALAEADDPMDRPLGAPLWPENESEADLARRRISVGPRVWQASYQQDPRPDCGALFHIQRIETTETPPEGRLVRAWDLAATAATEGRDPDWTVGLKLGRDTNGRFAVHDVVRFRGNPHEVEQAIRNTAQGDGRAVPIGIPQDPGQAGKQQVAWLTTLLAGHRVLSSPETGSKILRAGPVAGQVEAGNLTLVRAGWNRALLDELRDFPMGRKDDQVDALSRAFGMLNEAPMPSRRLNLPFLAR